MGWTATMIVAGDHTISEDKLVLTLADPDAYINFLRQAGRMGLVPKVAVLDIRNGLHKKYDPVNPDDRPVLDFNLEVRQELYPLPGTTFDREYHAHVEIVPDADHVPDNSGLTGELLDMTIKYAL